MCYLAVQRSYSLKKEKGKSLFYVFKLAKHSNSFM